MNKNRLVIVYWNLGIGGIQKRIRDIVIDISDHKQEWETYILLRSRLKEGFEDQLPPSPNVHIVIYPFDKRRIRLPGGFAFWLLLKYVQMRPHIVLTFLPQLALTLISIKRLVFWIHSALVINEGVVLTTYLKLRGLSWLHPVIRAYNTADKIIVPTQACGRDLYEHYSIDKRRIAVIPNWTLVKRHTPLHGAYDILYIGRFDAEKNVLSICDIVRQLKIRHPKVKALLVGSGDLLFQLRKKISDYRLENNIDIEMFHSDVLPYMLHAKVLILPSVSEGMPNVVLEAAMCRVPSVVNDFSGAKEVVLHKKTGFISTTNTNAAHYIHNLLTDERQRRNIGLRAQRFVAANYTRAAQARFITMLLS